MTLIAIMTSESRTLITLVAASRVSTRRDAPQASSSPFADPGNRVRFSSKASTDMNCLVVQSTPPRHDDRPPISKSSSSVVVVVLLGLLFLLLLFASPSLSLSSVVVTAPAVHSADGVVHQVHPVITSQEEDWFRSVRRMQSWDASRQAAGRDGSGGTRNDDDKGGGVCQAGSSRYDALACFLLSKVQIQLPSQSFHSGIFHLDIDALLCSNFTVSRLRAHVKDNKPTDNSTTRTSTTGAPSSDTSSASSLTVDPPVLSLNVNVAEMGTICTANYRTMGLGGSLTAIVGQPGGSVLDWLLSTPTALRDPFTGSSALDWTLQINSTTTTISRKNGTKPRLLRMPDAVRTASCQTQMQVTDLSFEGSISSHLVNVFRGQIASYVTTQINANLCPVLVSQVDPYVTNELHLLENWLHPYLEESLPSDPNASDASHGVLSSRSRSRHTTTFPVHDKDPTDWIDFDKDAPAVAHALQLVNSFVWGTHLDGGLLRHVFPNVVEGTYRHCGAGFDGWNGIMAALLGPSDDVLVLPIPHDWQVIEFDVNDDTHIRISLGDALQLRGVDHWTAFQLLLPSSLRSVNFDLSSTRPVSLDLQVTINVSSIAPPMCNHTRSGDPNCDMLTERVHISVNASHVDLKAAVELGADRTAFQAIPVGAVIDFATGLLDPTAVNSTRAIECVFGGLDRIEAKELAANLTWDAVRLSRPSPSRQAATVSRSTIATLSLSGLINDNDDDLERDVDQLLNEIVNRAVLHEYSDYVTAAVLGLSREPLPVVLNQAIERWVDSMHSNHSDPSDVCRSDEDLRFPNWVNFSTVDVLQQLNWWLDQSTTVQQLNDYVDCVVEFLTTALKEQFQTVRWSLDSNLGENSTSLSISLRNLQILNAGSLRHVRVMRPERDGTYLSTGLSYGSNTTFDALPQLELEVDMAYGPLNFTAQFNFTFIVNDVDLGLGSILSYDLNALKSTLLQHITRHGECLVAPADQWDWIDPEGRLGFVALSFNATARALTMDRPMFLKVDSDDHPSIREFCINLVFWTVDTFRDILKSFTGALQAQASRNCGSDGSNDGGEPYPSHLTSLMVIMAAVLLLAQPAVMLIQHKPQLPDDYVLDDEDRSDVDDLRRPILPQPTVLDPNLSLYDDDCDETDGQEVTLDAADDEASLMKKSRPVLSLGIAVALLTTTVLTLSSHMSSIASVDVMIVLGGRQVSLPAMVDVNPMRLAHRMNHVGFNPLFAVVGICSGALPYARLFLLLQAWASSYRVPVQRGRLLEIVDWFGKYAYVEVFVVVLAIVLFRFHASLDEMHVLDVFVSPKFGLYGFWCGSMVAAALGHVILFCHRRNAYRRRQAALSSPSNRRRSSVLTHRFTAGSASAPVKRQLSRFFYGLLLLWVMATLTLLSLGLSSDIFTVQFNGWASDLVLRDFSSSRTRTYSLLSLGSLFPSSVASPTSLAAFGLTAFYFATVLVVPLACLVLLGGLLVVPLSLDRQMAMLRWCEVARSWSAVEVTVLSVLVAVWQLPAVVNQAVQQHCDSWLQSIMAPHGSNELENGSCLRMESSLEKGALYLVGGVLLHTLLVAVCLRLARQSIEERLHRGDPRDRQAPYNVVQFWTRVPLVAQLLLAPPNDHYRLLDPSTSDDDDAIGRGPPLQGQGGVSGTEPWQVNTSFEEEWNDAAERDPEWKEWKDATMVT